MTVRTRMAPSPTGEFHIGGMRTLLYNFAFAKQNNGQFVIRIEDTDRARYVEGSVERLLKVIRAYGFHWDEGPEVGGSYEPYVQSERLEVYKKYAQELVGTDKAYYCFCTSERLEEMRETQKQKGISATKYDRHCLTLPKSEIEEKLSKLPYVIRLKVPENQIIKWVDGVLGEVEFNSNEIDDQILMKSDGFPTYHLGVVVDDHLMKITHVMRGNDWLSSTPKHILLYQAFGWEVPEYYHLPNLKELGGTKKLSKRHGPVSAQEFLEEGYLPEALVNYLMFLGWSPGTDREIYSLEDFIKDFDIKKIHKTDLVSFDRKKLEWLNGQYIQNLTDLEFANKIIPFVPKAVSADEVVKVAPLVKSRIKKLSEFMPFAGAYFERPALPDSQIRQKINIEHLQAAYDALAEIDQWEKEKIDTTLMSVVEKNGFKTGEFFMSLRISQFSNTSTPPINESIEYLGKDETLVRIKRLLK